MFFPLSILDEAAITGHCSNYLGYNVFDVDFGDNYVFKRCTQRRTFRCLMVGEVMGSHVFLCGTGGHSLALAKLNDHTAELFLKGRRWEFFHIRLWQRQSSSAAPPPQCWSASAVLWVRQPDEGLWDLSQLLLGEDKAYDFSILYTFAIHLLLCPAFLKASLSG